MDKKKIVDTYENLLLTKHADEEKAGWRGLENYRLRFRVLTEIGDLNGRSILDIGCGIGGFYEYLKGRGKEFKYTGYDVSPHMIAEAKSRYPKMEFVEKDVYSQDIEEEFDYVFMSGIFNLRLSSNYPEIFDVLNKAYRKARLGIAVNFISSYVDYKENYLFYAKPEKIFTFCKSLTKKVTLRHDYLPYDFTVYVFKET